MLKYKEGSVHKINQNLYLNNANKAGFFNQENSRAWDLAKQKEIDQVAELGYSVENKRLARKKFVNFDQLVFLPAQLSEMPLLDSDPVKTDIILGENSKKPVLVSTPVLFEGMSFGALSREAKIVLAKAASRLNTVANTGDGGMLLEERRFAKWLSVQYTPGRFGVDREVLAKADLIELRIGGGATAGCSEKLPAEKITGEIVKQRKITKGEEIIPPNRHLDIANTTDLIKMVRYLKEVSSGAPIILKLAMGRIEEDLAIALEAKPDIIALDGFGAGFGSTQGILRNEFGLPVLSGLKKAVDYLKGVDKQDQVQLIISGGLSSGADIAKALAMGADAVYLGTALLFAMGCDGCGDCDLNTCKKGIATHELKLRKNLNIEKQTKRAVNFVKAVTEDTKTIARMVSKDSIYDLDRADLRALDEVTAKVTGVELA